MKYLVLNGSPHKGNTWRLVECAINKIKQIDTECEIKELHLMELKIPFCIGCSNCFRKGREYCLHKNQIGIVLEAMEWADGIIVASTTFNMRETGLLKNLFDHLCYLLHRPHFFTKKALILTSVGGVGSGGALKSIKGTLHGIGFNKCYTYGCRTVSWNAFCPTTKHEMAIGKIATRFANDVKSQKIHYPKLSLLIPYNLFRGMGRYYAPGSEYATEDGIHWTKESRAHRTYDSQVPLHLYHKAFGSFFFLIGKVMGKKMIVTYKK